MLGFISKIFGGSKSEKDVKKIEPYVGKINKFFTSYQSLSNDELRSKTQDSVTGLKNIFQKLIQKLQLKMLLLKNFPLMT